LYTSFFPLLMLFTHAENLKILCIVWIFWILKSVNPVLQNFLMHYFLFYFCHWLNYDLVLPKFLPRNWVSKLKLRSVNHFTPCATSLKSPFIWMLMSFLTGMEYWANYLNFYVCLPHLW
jgi:hypothetical protein